MAAELKLLAGGQGDGAVQMVQLDDNLYYFGDGLNMNSFATTTVFWTRFDPYFLEQKPKESDKITEDILNYLEFYADDAAEELGKMVQERKQRHKEYLEELKAENDMETYNDEKDTVAVACIWMDSRGKVTERH